MRKIFTSKTSYSDAEGKAKVAGYQVVGRGTNKRNEYVVFGRR